MTLKQLKESTLYQSSDLDDMEVMIVVSRNGNPQLEPLCFLALAIDIGPGAVVVGGLTELQRQVESGMMKKPEGYISPSESNPKLFGDKNENETSS